MKKRGSAPDFTPSIPPNHELPGLHSQNQRDICLLWCFRYLAAAAITKSRSKNICKPLCFRNNDQTLQQLISNINFIINEKMKKGSWIIVFYDSSQEDWNHALALQVVNGKVWTYEWKILAALRVKYIF